GGAGFEDVFGGMFGGGGRAGYSQGGFEDLLGGMFGSGRFGTPRGGYRGFGGPTPGADITATTTLDFRTAIHGDTVTLQLLRGKGQPSPDGGEPGDLVLTVTVRPHPVFERDGLNLRVDVPVTFSEAALGATIEVPTLDGDPVRLRVTPGTPSGRVLRVKGRGVATAKSTGDLLATVHIVVPSHLSGEAKKKLEEFAALLPAENPRDELIAKARG